MKKFLFLVLFVICMTTAGCGEKATTSSATVPSGETTFENFAAEQTQLPQSNEESSVENNTVDVHGLEMPVPSRFEDENVYSQRIWSGQSASGDKIYYNITALTGYPMEYEADSYTVTDTPSIMWRYILEAVNEFYPAGGTNSADTVENEMETTMLGFDVIRRTGTIHAEKYGEVHKLAYSVYYGLLDFPEEQLEKIPVVWIAFSETDNADTKTELESIVDTAKEKSFFKEN